ncbi:hypothetical protein QNN00_10230 [Bacillus velezensis]|nr:hypothetical protein [Bacillus velezensis]
MNLFTGERTNIDRKGGEQMNAKDGLRSSSRSAFSAYQSLQV